VRVANAGYLQRDHPFVPAYLDAIGTNDGPVLSTVDFSADPDAVDHDINAFVAEATNDQIRASSPMASSGPTRRSPSSTRSP